MFKKVVCLLFIFLVVFGTGVVFGQTDFLYSVFGRVEVGVKDNTDRLIAKIGQQMDSKVDEIVDTEVTQQIDRANIDIESYLDQKLDGIENDDFIVELKHCVGYLTDNLIDEEKDRIDEVVEGIMVE